ncbi:cilia- and flagella-associated protein 107 isoform X1 [Paramormyrops kingsleyae]|uniref:cilia- and flagella-associated protein 107 isoform X1 n=1 Tax=Paramormyrops kingsleyae TaxID=1676925 RepID=UPI003B97C367
MWHGMGRPETKHDMWKIERKYSSRVLIGNWAEDKLKFTKEFPRTGGSSTYQHDYRPRRDHTPDVLVRGDALRRAEGVPAKLLLSHHGTPHSHCLVSLYDEMYGRKPSSTLRSWHPDKLAWVPERSDHPVQSPPTNFGLAESWRARWGPRRDALPAVSCPSPSAFVQTCSIRSSSAPAGPASDAARGRRWPSSSCTVNDTTSRLPVLAQM